MRPLTLSVGIPTFNQADFIEETIESLLNQTCPPDEIVISDNFSTDRTPDIIRKYAGRVRGIRPPTALSLTSQYNFTLANLTADWITALSSDDVARPNFCEVLARGAASREDAVLVRAGWENIDRTGTPVGLNYMLSVPKVEQPPNNLVSQKHGPMASAAAFAMKREAFIKSGPILESIETLADWALFVQLAPFGAFVYENELISGYRVWDERDKFRKRIGQRVRDEMRIYSEVLPLAAKRLGMSDQGWIQRASRSNFRRVLVAASREFGAAERENFVPLFEPWAQIVGEQELLKRFAMGEVLVTPAWIAGRAKALFRPGAQRLVGKLRK
jgi:glycosyltransferase involved in cell wall biosynthesis